MESPLGQTSRCHEPTAIDMIVPGTNDHISCWSDVTDWFIVRVTLRQPYCDWNIIFMSLEEYWDCAGSSQQPRDMPIIMREWLAAASERRKLPHKINQLLSDCIMHLTSIAQGLRHGAIIGSTVGSSTRCRVIALNTVTEKE